MEILFFMFVQLLQLRVSLTSPNSIGLLVFLLCLLAILKRFCELLWKLLKECYIMYSIVLVEGREEDFFFWKK